MIRESAIQMLNLIKNNDGLDPKRIMGQDMDIQKIVDIALSECRCSMIDKNGNYARFGSSTDIRIIKMLIQKLISNSNEISPEVVAMALTKEGVIGPFQKIEIEKKFDEKSQKYDIEMEEVFPNEFHVNMFKNDIELREQLVNETIKPYVKNIILENEVLMSKSPIMSYINKYVVRLFCPQKKDEELVQALKNNLKNKLPNTKDELVENISNYIFINIMNNKFFKQELIDRTLGTTELQKLGKISVGFNSLVENMSYETLQMIELRNFPYGEIISIKDTFFTLVAVLEALSTSFDGLNEDEIMHKIEEINKGFNTTNKNKNNVEIKYRTKEIVNSKYGTNSEFIDTKEVKQGLLNICKMIKVLLSKKDEIDSETYIKEVLRIHYRFIKVQAFDSANGRTARAIVNILLQSKGLIGIFRKEKRSDYFAVIEEANKLIKQNEEKYLDALVNNPMECTELENEFLSIDDLPFILVNG
ncbi:MAG: Fic family protein [Clostridia bacterium]|nr:Fic family protein [Clostridia bacterium]